MKHKQAEGKNEVPLKLIHLKVLYAVYAMVSVSVSVYKICMSEDGQ